MRIVGEKSLFNFLYEYFCFKEVDFMLRDIVVFSVLTPVGIGLLTLVLFLFQKNTITYLIWSRLAPGVTILILAVGISAVMGITDPKNVIPAMTIGIGALAVNLTYLGNSFSKPLKRIINDLQEAADQVSYASTQVSYSSQALATGSSEQASSLEEVSATLEEVSSMAGLNADNSNTASEDFREVSKATDQCTSAMSRLADAISRIDTSSSQTYRIIKTIDEIAFQTNLLALNAAVEAARAGESGKGFAVVAEEVRNLAQRSAEAAKNTSSLIEESRKNSENGVTMSQEVGELLNRVADGNLKVKMLMDEVSGASGEQNISLEQISYSVQQMDSITQQNASSAEESSAASEELSAQAASLHRQVEVLVALIEGRKFDGNGHYSSGRHDIYVANGNAAPTNELSPRVIAEERIEFPEKVIQLQEGDLEDF